jgi:hypothetical protein
LRYSKLVGLVLSVAVIGSAAPAWASGDPAVLPITFVNNTGVTPAYFTIIGQNPNDLTDPRWHRLTATGQFVPMMASDGVKDPNSPALANCDYNIPFPAKGAPPFPLPLVRAGRIYVSLGDKLVTQVNHRRQQLGDAGRLVEPR